MYSVNTLRCECRSDIIRSGLRIANIDITYSMVHNLDVQLF